MQQFTQNNRIPEKKTIGEKRSLPPLLLLSRGGDDEGPRSSMGNGRLEDSDRPLTGRPEAMGLDGVLRGVVMGLIKGVGLWGALEGGELRGE